MEKMNKDDLCTVLFEDKLIDETGTVNAITVNYRYYGVDMNKIF